MFFLPAEERLPERIALKGNFVIHILQRLPFKDSPTILTSFEAHVAQGDNFKNVQKEQTSEEFTRINSNILCQSRHTKKGAMYLFKVCLHKVMNANLVNPLPYKVARVPLNVHLLQPELFSWTGKIKTCHCQVRSDWASTKRRWKENLAHSISPNFRFLRKHTFCKSLFVCVVLPMRSHCCWILGTPFNLSSHWRERTSGFHKGQRRFPRESRISKRHPKTQRA